jgi:hypothetical protein
MPMGMIIEAISHGIVKRLVVSMHREQHALCEGWLKRETASVRTRAEMR